MGRKDARAGVPPGLALTAVVAVCVLIGMVIASPASVGRAAVAARYRAWRSGVGGLARVAREYGGQVDSKLDRDGRIQVWYVLAEGPRKPQEFDAVIACLRAEQGWPRGVPTNIAVLHDDVVSNLWMGSREDAVTQSALLEDIRRRLIEAQAEGG